MSELYKNFYIKTLKEMLLETKLKDYGLEVGKNIWILSSVEVYDELEKDVWKNEGVIDEN